MILASSATTSERYLLLIVIGMFLAGTWLALAEVHNWWERETELCTKPPSRIANLLTSISNHYSKRPTIEGNPSGRETPKAAGRTPKKTA
jgi:hypothetical protein